MTPDVNAFNQLGELLNQAETLSGLSYDHPVFSQWKLTVSALLEAHFGRTHDLAEKFRLLPFQMVRMFTSISRERVSPPPPTATDHAAVFERDLKKAKSIIGAARAVWSAVPAQTTEGSPQVHITNQNNNSAAAQSKASVEVEFPLTDLLQLVGQAESLTPEQKHQAKEHLEDLDGELRKANPRWEKMKPALKFMLDTGKEVAIKTIGAVAAKMLTGQ